MESFDFLIAAPYADKLPLKVAEYIRKDIPFAILIPLPLLNEIDRVSKTEIDPEIRRRRAQMKLIVSSSGSSVANKPPRMPREGRTALSIFHAIRR